MIDRLTLGLGKAAAITMLAYFCLKFIAVAHENTWPLLATSYGRLFLLEVGGFVLVPGFIFVQATRRRSAALARLAAAITVPGVILNRLTVSFFALNYDLPNREFFHPREIVIAITIITIELLLYRWVVNRLPVHRGLPADSYGH
jgi:hypothetical protein